jgi:hypothetical protein
VSRASRKRAAVAGLVLASLVLGPGCLGTSPAWHIPKGSHERFREARKVCRQLTDDADGPRPELFETCMERRGWRRERFYDGWFG